MLSERRIIYSCDDWSDSGEQIARFLAINNQIKTAAYARTTQNVSHINWTLDAVYHKDVNKDYFLKEVENYEPDLIISNAEPILANIAKTLKVPLWYCSQLHTFDGIEWDRFEFKYFNLLDSTKKYMNALPEADRIFVYSPFGDLINSPPLKPGYEWIQPYWISAGAKKEAQNISIMIDKERLSKLKKIFNSLSFKITSFSDTNTIAYKNALANCNWFFSSGDTSHISDAIYNCIAKLCVAPNLKEPEALLNANVCRSYGIGNDLAQVELMDKYAVDEIEKSFAEKPKKTYIKEISTPQLHEKIDEFFEKKKI